MIAVSASRKRILFAPLYLCLDELELLRPYTHPLLVLTRLGLEYDPLEKLILTLACTARDTRLREIHQLERALLIFARVSYAEVEPLLMTAGVRVHLHVKTVLTWGDAVSAKQIPRFEHCIN